MNSSEYKKIDCLVRAVEEFEISIEAADNSETIGESFYKRVCVTVMGEKFIIPIMDEFSDIETGNSVVLLNFVLSECEMYEDAEDIIQWAQDVGLKLADSCTHIIFRELYDVVPRMRVFIGRNTEAVSAYEIEFNTGVAKSLRAAIVSKAHSDS